MFELLSFICITWGFNAKSVRGLVCKEYRDCSSGSDIGVTARHGSETDRFTSRIPVWLESCNCDEKCYSFGDCCSDARPLKLNPLKDWSILNVRISPTFMYSVLMKTKCPDEWPNKKVRQMCENIGFKEREEYFLSELGHLVSLNNDEFLLWQVTSRSTLITYRNIYCAHCNNETQLEAWSHKIKCQSTPEGRKCAAIHYQTPPDFLIAEKVRRIPDIRIQISSSCNIGWYKANIQLDAKSTIDVVKNCSLLYAPVVVQDNKMQKFTAFKNEFCAQCSGYASSDLLCPSQSDNFFEHQKPKYWDTSVSFDTDFVSGGRIDNQNCSCPVGQVFDPFADKCREVVIEDTKDQEMINDNEDNEDSDEITNESLASDQNTTGRPKADESAIHSVQANTSHSKCSRIQFILSTILIALIPNAFHFNFRTQLMVEFN